ncbi:MAG: hypothetical protein A4E20_11055 [Nitrospira sp. SG-bin2]|uniref:single-stranded DNA-binding protein n=1 Tax=Nitrospira cf. moscoviensis SBR1015 TaxID=96242 RepID=UPI000A0BFA01|nr:single-stranded DNA-binding protein [Nitrospira cf. moscoviensis SBR1015]OQW34551.1 MAG: hypothetical protein A4E20_11055 [Nitrospira sp. SG-bin2]
MSLPQVQGSGTLTADPEGRFSPSGVAVTNLSIACNNRVFNKETKQYEDSGATFLRAVAFKQLAENINDQLRKGSRVVFSGQLEQQNWEDKEGNKRSSFQLKLDDIGPSLLFAAKSQPVEDPWGGPAF